MFNKCFSQTATEIWPLAPNAEISKKSRGKMESPWRRREIGIC